MAFQEGFERLFDIMSGEGMLEGGSVIVKDCLHVCLNLLSGSALTKVNCAQLALRNWQCRRLCGLQTRASNRNFSVLPWFSLFLPNPAILVLVLLLLLLRCIVGAVLSKWLPQAFPPADRC